MNELTDRREAAAGEVPQVPVRRRWALRIVPPLLTMVTLAAAGVPAWAMWQSYMATPWTRDGAVRAYIIAETPEVSGRIVNLPVIADQYVHKGDLLLEIDPTDYQIAVSNAEAVVAQAKTNLTRTRIVSPVNGYVTNLTAQVGDYAVARQRALSIVNTDSFWIEGYFEEDVLGAIHLGDPARVSLMGHEGVLTGHVIGIARGIEVPNAQSDAAGLATVNPIFTWIRLAQRVPVRIAIDHAPPDVTLVVGLTATVEILPPIAAKPSLAPDPPH
jgi:multidrug resistance efflux pump